MEKIVYLIDLILSSLYLVLPGLIANMVPVMMMRFDILHYPVDFGMRWKGKRLLGAHKTWRGVVFGTLAAIIVAFIQMLLSDKVEFFHSITLVDYSGINFLLIGFLTGFGALFGDMVESFFKRRINRKPGKPWIPWDQTDFIIGALLFLCIFYIPSWTVVLTLIILVPLLHITMNHIAFFLKIRDEKW